MLPDAELEDIRTELERELPDAGTIYSLTRTSDGQLGWTDSWATAGTCPCRVDFVGGGEVVQSGALLPYQRVIITVPHDTAITSANRFAHSSGTYSVQTVNLGSWLAIKRVSAEKIP